MNDMDLEFAWSNYPKGWPKCHHCALPALDGHLTCGNVRCDESSAREEALQRWRAMQDAPTKKRRIT